MNTRKIMLYTVALTLGGCSGANTLSGPRYMPRPDISQNNYVQRNYTEDHSDKVSYNEYEEREQCQNYRRLPRYYDDLCDEDLDYYTVIEMPAEDIIRSYTILFDFDKSDIRQDEIETLNRIVREINDYDPHHVTVTGYTDSHGTIEYNQRLSRQREQAVSDALLKRGIQNQTLNHESRGEYAQAVKTKDGVKNQANRRVVVDFRRANTNNPKGARYEDQGYYE
jgi:outer membrane protein OmpA-like peptidoglycan-associated protein